jgi:hypothetical protein
MTIGQDTNNSSETRDLFFQLFNWFQLFSSENIQVKNYILKGCRWFQLFYFLTRIIPVKPLDNNQTFLEWCLLILWWWVSMFDLLDQSNWYLLLLCWAFRLWLTVSVSYHYKNPIQCVGQYKADVIIPLKCNCSCHDTAENCSLVIVGNCLPSIYEKLLSRCLSNRDGGEIRFNKQSLIEIVIK